MKKLLALLLAMTMALSLTACGGSDEPDDFEPAASNEASEPVEDSAEEESTDSTGLTDKNGNEVSQETIAELTAAYNAIAIPFNEIATAANENGWMADEQTATELNAVSSTLGFIGTALTEDITMLDGSDFDTIINNLVNEFPAALDILSERVSVPYEG